MKLLPSVLSISLPVAPSTVEPAAGPVMEKAPMLLPALSIYALAELRVTVPAEPVKTLILTVVERLSVTVTAI